MKSDSIREKLRATMVTAGIAQSIFGQIPGKNNIGINTIIVLTTARTTGLDTACAPSSEAVRPS